MANFRVDKKAVQYMTGLLVFVNQWLLIREVMALKRLAILLLFLMIILGVAACEPEQHQQSEPVAVVEPEPEVESVKLAAVGDVMLARKVDRLMRSGGDDYPFAKLGQELQEADLAFANLESPLSARGEPMPGKGICFRGRPEMVARLAQAGFDVVSIANNHALDYDEPAFLDTLDLLTAAGIKAVGGGKNITEARQPVIIERKGLKIGFLAYTDYADIYFHNRYPRRFQATDEISGVAPLVEAEIREDIAALREQVDILVVSLHWGLEYVHETDAARRQLAHTLIDDGADIILGHHPHVLQGIESYNDGLIAYSLGNFIFDQNQKLSTRQGLMLEVELTPQGVGKATIYPVFIDESQPRIVSGEEAQDILDLVQKLSEDLDTILEVNQEGNLSVTTDPSF
jgi:poly-gamma-glutamate capsule biosynthesis protein CapA/YwtB (metallophosphatase superfamily)